MEPATKKELSDHRIIWPAFKSILKFSNEKSLYLGGVELKASWEVKAVINIKIKGPQVNIRPSDSNNKEA